MGLGHDWQGATLAILFNEV